jgi:hypothetical protein
MASITAFIQGISYFGSNTNKIYTSSDAGVHSTLADITTNIDCIETHPTLSYNYIGVADDGIYRHDQSGTSAERTSHWIINVPASASTSYISTIGMDDAGVIFMYHNLSGYVFRSDNLGKTNAIINTGLAQNLTGSSTAVGFVFTQNYVFMPMSNAKGIYKLTLTANTWAMISSLSSKTFAGISTYKTNGNIYSVANDGIYYSTNEGTSWTNSRTAVTSGHCIAVNQSNGYIFAGITEGGVSKILRSTDSAVSWSAVLTGSVVTSITINTLNSKLYIYNSSTTAVETSVNDGDVWTSSASPNVFQKLDVTQNTSPTIYGISSTGGIYSSADNLAAWTNSVTAGNPDLNTFRCIIINDKTSDIVVGGDSITSALTSPAVEVKLSENTTWRVESIKFGEVSDIKFDSNGNLVYSLTKSGFFKKSPSGSIDAFAFDQINTGLTNTRIKQLIVNGTTCWTVTKNGLFKLDTGTYASWTASSTGITNLDLLSIAIDGSLTSRMYVGSNGSGVYKSTDSGATWAYVGLTGHKITALIFMYSGNIFASSYGHGLYLSSDNGTTWTLVSSLSETSVRKIGKKNSSEFYVSAFD